VLLKQFFLILFVATLTNIYSKNIEIVTTVTVFTCHYIILMEKVEWQKQNVFRGKMRHYIVYMIFMLIFYFGIFFFEKFAEYVGLKCLIDWIRFGDWRVFQISDQQFYFCNFLSRILLNVALVEFST
jgi:hypothetical protein